MKKTGKIIKIIMFILAAAMIFALTPLSTVSKASAVSAVSAEDISWKQSLKDFLINNFPSLFNEATIKKNREVFDNWLNSWGTNENGHTDYDLNTYVPEPGDIPADALGEWKSLNPYYPLLLPFRYRFYDLDGDGIPEVFISYPTWYAEGFIEVVYKLYNGNYEKIDTGEYLNGTYMAWDDLYINSRNKTAVIRYYPDGAGEIAFLTVDIDNKKIIYSDYVDSNGNSYNDLWALLFDSETGKYDGAKFDEIISGLTLIPEFDCTDIIESIKNPAAVPAAPNTGNSDTAVLFVHLGFIITSLLIFVNYKIKSINQT